MTWEREDCTNKILKLHSNIYVLPSLYLHKLKYFHPEKLSIVKFNISGNIFKRID